MNLSLALLGIAICLGVGTAGLACVVPTRIRPSTTATGTILIGVLGVVSGLTALLSSRPVGQVTIDWLVPLTGVRLSLDALGGLFVTVIGAVTLTAGVYAIGYTADGRTSTGLAGRHAQAPLPIFCAAMLWSRQPAASERS